MQQQLFEHILENNKSKIYRICRVYAVSPIEPQDLFQEVIFEIWKSLSGFKNNANVATWVYRITLNVCLRSKLSLDKKNSNMVRYDSIKYSVGEPLIDEVDSEKYTILKTCIASLNESDTSIIVLYLEALSYREIARITGLSENHVAVKMKRIRKKLSECMIQKMN